MWLRDKGFWACEEGAVIGEHRLALRSVPISWSPDSSRVLFSDREAKRPRGEKRRASSGATVVDLHILS